EENTQRVHGPINLCLEQWRVRSRLAQLSGGADDVQLRGEARVPTGLRQCEGITLKGDVLRDDREAPLCAAKGHVISANFRCQSDADVAVPLLGCQQIRISRVYRLAQSAEQVNLPGGVKTGLKDGCLER